jgi:dephospho-CoA kinase
MIIYENAILFENGFDKLCDYILTIVAPTELKIQRVIRRDGCTEKQVTERMNNQWSDEKKIAHSHFVIENIDWKTTEKEVDRIYNVLIAEIQKDTLKNINLDFDEF